MQRVIGESRFGQFRLGSRERHTIIAFCSLAVAGLVVLAIWSSRSDQSVKADRLLSDVTDEEADGSEVNLGSPDEDENRADGRSNGTLKIFTDGVATTVRPTVPAAPSTSRTTVVVETTPPTTQAPTTETTAPTTETTTETTAPTTETTLTTITKPTFTLPSITRPTITLPTITRPTYTLPTYTFPTFTIPGPPDTFPPFPQPTIGPPIDPPDAEQRFLPPATRSAAAR